MMIYKFILLPIIAALVAQLIKLVIDAIKGKFSWKDLNSYGGMPSSHAAMVTALAATIGYFEGWDSIVFAFSLIFAILIIRDAGGFRIMLGSHAEQLNKIVHQLDPQNTAKFNFLRERIGHTPVQLFFGMLVGILTVVVYILVS